VRQLEAHGFSDPPLHRLLKEVERQTGEIEAGTGI
jgi:cation transport protein ChaC